MDKTISFDYSRALGFFEHNDLNCMFGKIRTAHDLLQEKNGAGSDFLGWVELPSNYNRGEFAKIEDAATRIRENSDVLVVIGIGGSYLGAKAVIDCVTDCFYNYSAKTKIFFAGNNLSASYINALLREIKNIDVSINVISKSGTTTEPAIAFKILKEFMEKKYGKEKAKDRIFVTTSKYTGILRTLSEYENYETFVVPDDVGGRFSVLTAVGLLPIAVSGANINDLLSGAASACESFRYCDLSTNDCYQYAAVRNILYSKGKSIEILANYDPELEYFSKWWTQLYGESEGKNSKGIFPTSVNFSTDLHSIGQYIQEGSRNIFETVIHVKTPKVDFTIDQGEINDGLNFLNGKTIDFVNKKAFLGTQIAHVDGGVPNLTVNIDYLDEYNIGQLIYFFEKACGISGYILGVNPFNQPGVEEYKKNMFALLGKPGFERHKLQLEEKILSTTTQ